MSSSFFLRIPIFVVLFLFFFLFSVRCDFPLTPGTAVQIDLQASTPVYYYLDLPPLANRSADLTISVTAIGSGDPDLFVDFNATHPDYDAPWQSVKLGKDAITISRDYLAEAYFDSPRAFIMVESAISTRCTLVAFYDSPIVLALDRPQSAPIVIGQTRNFLVDVPTSVASITISASSSSGSANVATFVNPDYEASDYEGDYYWSNDAQGGSIFISRAESGSDWPTNDRFFIAVECDADSVISVLVSTPLSNEPLTIDRPIAGRIAANEKKYYEFDYSLTDATCELHFSLTAVSGDPDLLIARTTQPSESTPGVRVSAKFGSDDLIYTQPITNGKFYLTVTSIESSLYTLLVTTVCSGPTVTFSPLLDGRPQYFSIAAGATAYFRFTTQKICTTLSLALASDFGSPQLFANIRLGSVNSDRPSAASADFRSPQPGSSTLFLEPSNIPQCLTNTSVINIAVTSSSATSFTLTAAYSGSITRLQEGSPFTGSVGEQQYSYFKFQMTQFNKTFQAVLTTLGRGDADLYATSNSSYQHVTRANSIWQSALLNDDAITIPPSDPNSCYSLYQRADARQRASFTCYYYISVYGFSASSFTLLAKLGGPIALSNGIPQQGVVTQAVLSYYSVELTPSFGRLTISVQSAPRPVSVYVSNSDSVFPEPEQPNTYQKSVPPLTASQSIVISQGDAAACRIPVGGLSCKLIIAVEGTANSSFSITATTGGAARRLQNGSPVSGTVRSGQTDYYMLEVLQRGLDASIVLTMDTDASEADLFVSNSTQTPGENDNLWSSTWEGDDEVDVQNIPRGQYWIAVKPINGDAQYTITALLKSRVATDPSNLRQLVEGSSLNELLIGGTWNYYSFRLSAPVDSLLVTVTASFGDPDLYITRGYVAGSRLPIFPTTETGPDSDPAGWAANQFGSDQLEISNPPLDTYTIGVFAWSATRYSIQLSTATSAASLREGVAVVSQIRPGQIRYYRFHPDRLKDISITVTAISGDPDVYVWTQPPHTTFPNKTTGSYTWKGDSYSSDAIDIASGELGVADPHYCLNCDYLIAVYGYIGGSYSILIHYGQVTHLSSGVPQRGTVMKHDYARFDFTPSPGSQSFTLTLSPIGTSMPPYMLVSRTSEPFYDQSNSYQFSLTSLIGGELKITRAQDPNQCWDSVRLPCKYQIALYGLANSSYTLTASETFSNRNSSVTLQNNVPFASSMDGGSWKYFTFNVPYVSDVIISVTPTYGDPDLFVSDTLRQPDERVPPQWSSRMEGGDSVVIPNAHSGDWYIGIQAYSATAFTVLAYVYDERNPNTNAIQLSNGIAQSGVVASGKVRYYQFDARSLSGSSDLEISLAKRVGDPDLYVAVGEDARPDPTNRHSFNWSSINPGSDSVTIRNAAPAIYVIGISGFTTSEYTILARSSQSTQQLTTTPIQLTLADDQWAYFVINIPNFDRDLTVQLTSLSGDPDLYVDYATSRPNATANFRSGAQWRSDSVTIDATELRNIGRSVWYASVRAFTASTFAISIAFNEVRPLSEGDPQAGSVLKEARVNYYISFDLSTVSFPISINLDILEGQANLLASWQSGTEVNPDSPDAADRYDLSPPSLTITQADFQSKPCFSRNRCNIYIAVEGVRDCRYSLRVSSAQYQRMLQNGVAMVASVPTKGMIYFQFINNQPIAAIEIAVTPLNSESDPDLFVSTVFTRPNSSHSRWRSENFGSDVLLIDYTESEWVVGRFYIGVFGSTGGSFSITATVISLTDQRGSDAINLLPGQPQLGAVRSGSSRLYRFRVIESSPISFILTPRSGDPDLYIDLVTRPNQPPPGDNARYKSYNWGRDQIGIAAEESCDGRFPCEYLISVRAAYHSVYSLVASVGFTQLEPGISRQVTLKAKSWAYFFTSVADASPSDQPRLVVSVAALSGDPDVFVSNQYRYPNSSNTASGQRGEFEGSDVVSIPNAAAGMWYIGVYAFTNSTFAIQATTGHIMLFNGEIHLDRLGPTETRRYWAPFFSQFPDEFTLQVDPFNGAGVSLYGTNRENDPDPQESPRTQFVSLPNNGSSANLIRVPADDRRALQNVTYRFLAVNRLSYPVIYHIQSYYGDAIRELPSGRQLEATVSAGQCRYFRGLIDDVSFGVNVGVTELYGNIALVASDRSNMRPGIGAQKHKWMSPANALTHGNSLSISEEELVPIVLSEDPSLYIGVCGVENSRFSILLTTGMAHLNLGSPFYCENWYQNSFLVELSELGDLIIAIAAIVPPGSAPPNYKLFVATSESIAQLPSDTDLSRLDETHSTWQLSLYSGQALVLSATDAQFCKLACNFYLTVVTTDPNPFEILVSSTGSATRLFSDGDFRDTFSGAMVGSYKNYQLYVASAARLHIELQVCQGSADLFGGFNPNPNENEHSQWAPAGTQKQEWNPAVQSQESALFLTVRQAYAGPVQYRLITRTYTGNQYVDPNPVIAQSNLVALPISGGFLIRFQPAQPAFGNAAALNYTLVWSPSGMAGAVFTTACGLQAFSSATKLRLPVTDPNAEFSFKLLSSTLDATITYKFNILVEESNGGVPSGAAVYSPAIASLKDAQPAAPDSGNSNGGGVSVGMVVGILIPIAILIGGALYYLIKKNRKMASELSIEMEDVPRSVLRKAVRGPAQASKPNKQTEKYAKLVTGDDEPDLEEQEIELPEQDIEDYSSGRLPEDV